MHSNHAVQPHSALDLYIENILLTGDIPTDAAKLLMDCGRADTADHSQRVAMATQRLAMRWNVDLIKAEVAAWLHDISAIVPRDVRLQLAEGLGVEILAEERIAPVLIHQKLSAVIAQDIFAITDPTILSAIGCHTTLKANSSALDKVVFVADKIAWDQPGTPPYLAEMTSVLDTSLDLAAYCYLQYLWEQRETLPAMHPWAAEAYRELGTTARG